MPDARKSALQSAVGVHMKDLTSSFLRVYSYICTNVENRGMVLIRATSHSLA